MNEINMETDAEAAQPDNERGELVTDILQRRLSCLAVSDSPLHDLLSLLHSNNAVADVVFHVCRSNSGHRQNPPSADENANVVRVLAHSCILRRESDYFREILQPAHADYHEISSANDQYPQDDADYPSNLGADATTHASSMARVPQCDDSMYLMQNPNMQEEHVTPVVGVHSPEQSVSASTMNDLIGREVLAHVQAQILERVDDQVARRPSGQEYYSCHSSFVSADGISDYQTPENTSDDHSSLCSTSIAMTQLPATSSMSRPTSHLSRTSLIPLPASDCQPHKSILLNNEDRKVSIAGFTRKSVRFSLQQADIILPTSMADSYVPRLNTGDQQSEEEERGKHLNEDHSSDDFHDEKGLNDCGEAMCSKEVSASVMDPEYIDQPLIKRRQTEVNMVMRRGGATHEKRENEEDASTDTFKIFVVKKLTWTEPVLIGIMEWLYLGVCHINPEDLPALYDAAYRASITSLTWCIRRHSMPDYLSVALSNPLYCKSLLDFCHIADCAELSSLKNFCEVLQAINGQTKVAVLETKPLPGSAHVQEFLSEGFFVLEGHPLCMLKACKANEFESPRDYESKDQPALSFLTFAKHLQPSPSSSIPTSYQQKSISNCESKHDQIWKVVLLDDDPAGSLYVFFKYMATMLSSRNETKNAKRSNKERGSKQQGEEGHWGAFKLQMITRFKVGSVLVECLREAIGEGIRVREKRGAGAYIKGPSYCTSIVIKGDPWKVLMAAKAIPYDMVGRSALKIRAPCVKTFSSLFHASHTFGVDLHNESIVLVKPLYVLIKVLEFMTNLNTDAYEVPSTERTFIELNQPTEPF